MNKDETHGNAVPPAEPAEQVRVAAVEEKLTVRVRETETGAVRVRKVVHEEVQPLVMRLSAEQVQVTRVAWNRPVDERSEPRREGDTLIIPVYEYIPVVKMQLTLKEEVHVKTTQTHRDVAHDVTVDSEEIIVERREGLDGDWKREPE
ncbi:DUF2382 domain-containing protein [Paraburkholderia sp. MPAMCS5]|uniref:YsnF/AvaK domain-containing protein n=1 Tax=Paraburkholderia sp. MPAMCS5 TaxID=3112563 RepID=UPI002E18BFB9|nr:DUF2382 domain-containing protein [Paraburkholderia sp. MPAMCS5]